MTEENDSIELFKAAIADGSISSESLAAQVVAYRALKMNREHATLAMAELGSRRANGDPFEFEQFIDVELAKIPKIPEFNIRKLTGNLNLQTISRLIRK